jgi:hypothetical protein
MLGYRLAELEWKHCEGERRIARKISYTLHTSIVTGGEKPGVF